MVLLVVHKMVNNMWNSSFGSTYSAAALASSCSVPLRLLPTVLQLCSSSDRQPSDELLTCQASVMLW